MLESRRAGSRDKGKVPDRPDPEGLKVGPPSTPSDGIPSYGQELERHFPGRRPNSTAADETQRRQKSTESAEAESILRRVKGSSKSYPPLRSVAENLCLILDNQRVWPPSCPLSP